MLVLSEGYQPFFQRSKTPGIRLYPGRSRCISDTLVPTPAGLAKRPCPGRSVFLNVNDEARWNKTRKPWLAHVSTWNIDVHMVYYIYLYTTIYTYFVYTVCVFWCVFFFWRSSIGNKIITWKPVDELGPLSANHGCGFFFSLQLDGWKLHNAPGLDQHRMMGYIHPVDVQ